MSLSPILPGQFVKVPNVVSSPAGESVNVKAYGAKGDGVTDDTTAIQNAINTGANVYLPGLDSVYAVSQLSLGAFPGQKLFGQGSAYTNGGSATTILHTATSGSCIQFPAAVDISSISTSATAPLVTTKTAHGYAVNDVICIDGTTGSTCTPAINTNAFQVASVPSGTTFTLKQNGGGTVNCSVSPTANTGSTTKLFSRIVCLENFRLAGQGTGNSTIGIRAGIGGNQYTANHWHARNLMVANFGIGVYNGKADASGFEFCNVSGNGQNLITDGNQDDFGCFKCTFNDSVLTNVTVQNGGSMVLTGALLANSAITSGNAILIDGGGSKAVLYGGHLEGLNNTTADGIFIQANANCEVHLFGVLVQTGGVTERTLYLNTSAHGYIYGGVATAAHSDGAHVYLNGSSQCKAFAGDAAWVGNYNGIRLFQLGDYFTQSGDNSLPGASNTRVGEKYFQLYASPFWTSADEMYICTFNGSANVWRSLQLSAYDRSSNPHVAGLLYNNSGVATFSTG